MVLELTPRHGKLGWQPFWSGVNPKFPKPPAWHVIAKRFKEPMVAVARYHLLRPDDQGISRGRQQAREGGRSRQPSG
jgi:hypothetical protein